MKRVAVLVAAVLALSACGPTMQELADARDECNELGGVFIQNRNGIAGIEPYRCDFDQREVSE